MTKDFRREVYAVRFRRSHVLSKGSTLADHIPSMTTFHHRANDDRTFDSICMCCYRTVASGAEESQLVEFECDHICEDRFIRSYQS
jgi:hypothetical protein